MAQKLHQHLPAYITPHLHQEFSDICQNLLKVQIVSDLQNLILQPCHILTLLFLSDLNVLRAKHPLSARVLPLSRLFSTLLQFSLTLLLYVLTSQPQIILFFSCISSSKDSFSPGNISVLTSFLYASTLVRTTSCKFAYFLTNFGVKSVNLPIISSVTTI